MAGRIGSRQVPTGASLARLVADGLREQAARAEPNPFANLDVVGEVERGAAEFRGHMDRIAERWRVAPEEFAPWESRPGIVKLVTAATPEQVEEASRLWQSMEEGRQAGQSEYVRHREAQYFAEYARQKRQQDLAGRLPARPGSRGGPERRTTLA